MAVPGEHRPQKLEIVPLEEELEGPRLQRNRMKYQFTVDGGLSLSQPSASIKPVTLCVYTMDRESVCSNLQFNSGRLTTTEQILDRVMQDLKLPSENRNVFSLWLKSKHLQLQLKPYHLPCKLFKRWKDLLSQYTSATYEEVCDDLPILTFQRHVFLALSDEKKLLEKATQNSTTISLLFHETVCNVTNGTYPMTREELHTLAGIQAAIKLTSSKDLEIRRYYPNSVFSDARGFSLFSRKSSIVKHIQNETEKAKRAAVAVSEDPNQLKITYLRKCWRQNYYGSVMFRGQIKKPFKAIHRLAYSDRQIVVAINKECVHILSADSPSEILLYLPLDHLCWQFQPCENEGEDFYSSLWLEYSTLVSVGGEDKKVIKLLQIFSRQAPMMDAMLGRCDEERKSEHLDSQSQGTPKVAHVCQEHKLDCEVFSEDGKPLTLSKTKPKSNKARATLRNPSPTEDLPAIGGQSAALKNEEHSLQGRKPYLDTDPPSPSKQLPESDSEL